MIYQEPSEITSWFFCPMLQLANEIIEIIARKHKVSGEFESIIQRGINTVVRHQQCDIMQILEYIPVDKIHAKAEEFPDIHQHAIVKSLLHWYKNEFFVWVDCLPCCGQVNNIGMTEPNSQHLEHGATRVEKHQCTQCKKIQLFPRFNDPIKLLETRRGRCGEWANCFCIILRAMGLEVRYVHDFTDHVWAEFYSDSEQRWIHLDPCENAFDNPHLYETGWGKKLTYIIAFGDYEIKDITSKHVKDMEQIIPRRNMGNSFAVYQYLYQKTKTLRDNISIDLKTELLARDIKEFEFSKEIDWRLMTGRQSGSVEWRTIRGEMGQ